MAWKLNYTDQTGSFTVGNAITGATSGATGTITGISDDGATGTLFFAGVPGTFENNEIIYESALGAEIVTGTDSDMSGANNWVGTQLGTFDINTTVAGKMYMLGNGVHDWAELGGAMSADKFYKISLKARLNAGAPTAIKIGSIGNDAPNYIEVTPTNSEQTFVGYCLAKSTTLYIGLIAPGFNGIAFEIDDVSVKQATNAAFADGAVIVLPGVMNFEASTKVFNFNAKEGP